VVIVENCVRRLSHAQEHLKRELTLRERFHEVFAAAKEARRPLLFGQLIIMVVYLPIFALAGVEGKMFHPWPSPWLRRTAGRHDPVHDLHSGCRSAVHRQARG
jgi:Cu/Ag efflux pump CusA